MILVFTCWGLTGGTGRDGGSPGVWTLAEEAGTEESCPLPPAAAPGSQKVGAPRGGRAKCRPGAGGGNPSPARVHGPQTRGPAQTSGQGPNPSSAEERRGPAWQQARAAGCGQRLWARGFAPSCAAQSRGPVQAPRTSPQPRARLHDGPVASCRSGPRTRAAKGFQEQGATRGLDLIRR